MWSEEKLAKTGLWKMSVKNIMYVVALRKIRSNLYNERGTLHFKMWLELISLFFSVAVKFV